MGYLPDRGPVVAADFEPPIPPIAPRADEPPRLEPPLLSQCEGVLDALDDLWSAMRETGVERVRVEPLRPVVGHVALSARGVGLYPEKLLWLLKESWRSLPEVRRAPNRYGTEETLALLVTMCIEEYYAVQPSRDAPDGA